MGPPPLSLLIVDDDPAIRRIFSTLIAEREGVSVQEASQAEEALEILERRAFDIVFADLQMPGIGGMMFLELVKRERPSLEVVMVTAHGTIESAVQAMKLGASDFLPKPFKLEQVTLILERLRRVAGLRRENERLRQELQDRYRAAKLLGLSPAMDRCHELIDRVRRQHCNVLILGESGSGKELIARAVHYDGERRDGPFVPIDCGAIQGSLLESELFGHEKGAFTGAVERKTGLFEVADGGTVFLDEVGEIPLEIQPALLRALEEKEIRPVGATAYRKIDVRFVAASNRPLEAMAAEGRFRRDLFYRLNVVAIRVPPLRERKEDLPILAAHFLKKGARDLTLAPRALRALERYDWPGNVRELEHALEHASAMAGGREIGPEDLPPAVLGSGTVDRSRSIERMETDAIRSLMKEHGRDTAKVASILGIDRSTLYRKLKRYGISRKA
ncbi:MAG TPA: sigma-54 dependent transcriptional regulator [Planctomycetota bacterium]|nr:sigma-54 dependent transcriptional regulator [Planctomycetota bacterium]